MTNESQSRVESHLLGLHDKSRKIILSSSQNNAKHLGPILRLDLDIGIWETRIASRPEKKQLGDARRELAFAVYAASSGLYRLAYAGLRLFLELSFASVYFSANELHRRKWIADRKDFSWSSALDKESGVLSQEFVREFCEAGLNDAPKYATIAAKCYRHCSQFVHGKDITTSLLPEDLSYSFEILADWSTTAKDAAESVLYLLYCRYSEEVFDTSDSALCDTLEHSFSHLRTIRKLLGLPIEGE
ncbi:hypothetical protein ACFOWE_29070 [Planomonospora corallina]|uniref:HEPN domain-containing protein n=1 Tax=Planomonospora corallina TaxID=1806052 RepID=A0ABV8IFT5_9ACTN